MPVYTCGQPAPVRYLSGYWVRDLQPSLSQVTRLCDLTNDNDTVTSVSWAERGNFVAVGTHRGYVQVGWYKIEIGLELLNHIFRSGTWQLLRG